MESLIRRNMTSESLEEQLLNLERNPVKIKSWSTFIELADVPEGKFKLKEKCTMEDLKERSKEQGVRSTTKKKGLYLVCPECGKEMGYDHEMGLYWFKCKHCGYTTKKCPVENAAPKEPWEYWFTEVGPEEVTDLKGVSLPKKGDRFIEIVNKNTMEHGETYTVVDIYYSIRDRVPVISFVGDSGTLWETTVSVFMGQLLDRDVMWA